MAVYVSKRGIVETGAVTEEELAMATATPAKVLLGYTFYAGTPELQTGTALATPTTAMSTDIITGKLAYDNNGNLMAGSLLPSGTFITTSQWTCTLGPDSLPGGTYLGEDYQYQNISIPSNANLAVIELTAQGPFDPQTAIAALVVNIKGSQAIWDSGQIVVSYYGTGGASYSMIDQVSIQDATTLRMRCYVMTGQYSKIRNTIKVHFYS